MPDRARSRSPARERPRHPRGAVGAMGEFYNHILAGVEAGRRLAIPEIVHMLCAQGWTAEQVMEIIDYYASLSVLYRDPDNQHIVIMMSIPASGDAQPAIEAPLPTVLAAGAASPIYLLSLFDGIGMARLGVEQILYDLGLRAALAATWFVELDERLGCCVAARWAQQQPPYLQLTNDAWNLVRQPELLMRILQGMPSGALILLIGGPPCQQLSTFGRGGAHWYRGRGFIQLPHRAHSDAHHQAVPPGRTFGGHG